MSYPTRALGVSSHPLICQQQDDQLQAMKILLVDDEPAQVAILRSVLRRAGFNNLTVVQDPREVLSTYEREQPDLMLLDMNMPHLSGLQVMDALRSELAKGDYFPILVLTADARASVKQNALASGARDFLAKPFDSTEVVLRVRNLLETRRYHRALKQQNDALEHEVSERTRQLERSQVEMLVRLARAAEYRDDKSGEHVWRVSQLAAQLASELGLERGRVELIMRAARLHDVGKIAIPDGILMKPSQLTPQEFEVIKTHTTAGAKLLSGGHSPLMKLAEIIALTHHERWDGSGYPQGLKGESIPLEGRILALADAVDALTHDRAHQKACSLEEAVEEVRRQSGKQFDPKLVEALLRLYARGEVGVSVPDVKSTMF